MDKWLAWIQRTSPTLESLASARLDTISYTLRDVSNLVRKYIPSQDKPSSSASQDSPHDDSSSPRQVTQTWNLLCLCWLALVRFEDNLVEDLPTIRSTHQSTLLQDSSDQPTNQDQSDVLFLVSWILENILSIPFPVSLSSLPEKKASLTVGLATVDRLARRLVHPPENLRRIFTVERLSAIAAFTHALDSWSSPSLAAAAQSLLEAPLFDESMPIDPVLDAPFSPGISLSTNFSLPSRTFLSTANPTTGFSHTSTRESHSKPPKPSSHRDTLWLYILEEIIRPRLTKARLTRVNHAGRKIHYEDPLEYTPSLFEELPWMGANRHVITQFAYILGANSIHEDFVRASQSSTDGVLPNDENNKNKNKTKDDNTNKNNTSSVPGSDMVDPVASPVENTHLTAFLQKHWPLVTPFLLVLTDEMDTGTRQRGLACLLQFVRACPDHVLHDRGLGPVIQEAVLPSLTMLPPLTPVPESVVLVHLASAILRVLARRQTDLRERNKLYDVIVRQGLLVGWSHATEFPMLVLTLARQTEWLVNDLGIRAVAHLRHLLPIFHAVLTHPFATAHVSSLLSVLQALRTVLAHTWPRFLPRTSQPGENLSDGNSPDESTSDGKTAEKISDLPGSQQDQLGSDRHAQVVSMLVFCWRHAQASGDAHAERRDEEKDSEMNLLSASLRATMRIIESLGPVDSQALCQQEPLLRGLFD